MTRGLERYQPELEIRRAHDIRRIEPCACGGMGMRDHMIKIAGKWWHGGKYALDIGYRHGA